MHTSTKFALALTCMASAWATAFSQSQHPLYTFPLGVEGYTFRRSFPLDATKTLDTIQMMGFTELEGSAGKMAPDAFREQCKVRGITIPSTGASYEELLKAPDSVARRAKLLGARYVMCAWIPHTDGVLTFADASKAVSDFNAMGKYLSDQGLIFCYHAHGYEFQPYQDGTLLDYIIKNTNPTYVSFEMDIFWIQFGGGDPVALLKKYGRRWKLIHLKDLRKGAVKNLTGQTAAENNVPLGSGEIDIPGVLTQAKRLGISHYFIEDESNREDEYVPQSIQYLKNLKE